MLLFSFAAESHKPQNPLPEENREKDPLTDDLRLPEITRSAELASVSLVVGLADAITVSGVGFRQSVTGCSEAEK